MPATALRDLSDLPRANARLAAEIARRLNVKAGTLGQAVQRGKGRLPAGLLAELAEVEAAEAWLDHPHLRPQVDLARARDVHRRTRAALGKVDLKRSRERYWLGLLAGLAVNLALLAAGVLMLLRWRGLI
jgi:hypothetical protein